jgi:hypothetical protein
MIQAAIGISLRAEARIMATVPQAASPRNRRPYSKHALLICTLAQSSEAAI